MCVSLSVRGRQAVSSFVYLSVSDFLCLSSVQSGQEAYAHNTNRFLRPGQIKTDTLHKTSALKTASPMHVQQKPMMGYRRCRNWSPVHQFCPRGSLLKGWRRSDCSSFSPAKLEVIEVCWRYTMHIWRRLHGVEFKQVISPCGQALCRQGCVRCAKGMEKGYRHVGLQLEILYNVSWPVCVCWADLHVSTCNINRHWIIETA